MPVMEWLKKLGKPDREIIGSDLRLVEKGWPLGMPICRSLDDGLFETRSNLSNRRTARVIFFIKDGKMGILHGFIKKTQQTPRADIELAKNANRKWKMTQNNHWGQTLESFLEEEGMLDDANAYATKKILAWQISEAMKEQGISKSDMAKKMKTSRSSLDRLLDPDNGSLNLATMERAATALGRKVMIQLI